jgi:hypothetical protein
VNKTAARVAPVLRGLEGTTRDSLEKQEFSGDDVAQSLQHLLVKEKAR